MKQLLDQDLAVGQALLVQILRERGDLAHVLVDAVGPEVFAHDRHGLFGLCDQPGVRHHQRIDVEQVDHSKRLGLAERLIDARRQPGIFLHQFLANADQVHDREHSRLLVIGLLGGARVGKQPLDVRLAAQER